MNKRELFVRCISVMLGALMLAVAYGRESLLNLASHGQIPREKNVAGFSQNNSFAIAKTKTRILGKEKISIIRGENGEIPFLAKGIKYKCIEWGEYLAFCNSNQSLIYSMSEKRCIYFEYICDPGEPRLTGDDCMEIARRAYSGSFFVGGVQNVNISNISGKSDRVYTYLLETVNGEGRSAIISVRADTGSIIFFKLSRKETE